MPKRRIDTPKIKSSRIESRKKREARHRTLKEEAERRAEAKAGRREYAKAVKVHRAAAEPLTPEQIKQSDWAHNLLTTGIVQPGGTLRNKHGTFTFTELVQLAALVDRR